ncbi:MAG: UDP-2,3-diacylglucosamine diphosphatase LpxI [Planctomycetia bacterium]|nr:UDP-2,3-diacylglucosamine diphosphatase LpxI [Planctomycetia bacterium]
MLKNNKANLSPHLSLNDLTKQPKRIGLIAGWGRYPIVLAKTLKDLDYEIVCLGVYQHADPELIDICDIFQWSGLARFASACRFFRKNGISQATMAGKIHKRLLLEPWFIWRQLPDFFTIRMFMSHFLSLKKDCKDDSLLLTVVEAFAQKGIELLPGTDFAPELLMKRQLLTRRWPSAAQWKDICFGWTLAREMGRLDIGQSVSVKNQAVLAVEAIEGTDAAIRRAGSLCRGNGFTVVKVSKPQQDMRFDVPTFGMGTLQTMVESGANVLAIEAGKTIFVDKKETIDFANKHNIVIVSILEEDVSLPESPFSDPQEIYSPVCPSNILSSPQSGDSL